LADLLTQHATLEESEVARVRLRSNSDNNNDDGGGGGGDDDDDDDHDHGDGGGIERPAYRQQHGGVTKNIMLAFNRYASSTGSDNSRPRRLSPEILREKISLAPRPLFLYITPRCSSANM